MLRYLKCLIIKMKKYYNRKMEKENQLSLYEVITSGKELEFKKLYE